MNVVILRLHTIIALKRLPYSDRGGGGGGGGQSVQWKADGR